jgi:integrase/recombinase XerD
MRGTIVLLLLLTGLRNQELCDLQLRDLPWKHGKNEITVRKGKGHKGGTVIVSPWVRQFLDDIVSQKTRLTDTEWLLRNEAGKKFQTANIRNIVSGAGRNTNWAFIRPHKLRHTYGSVVYFLTDNLRFVQKQLRHTSSTTTDIYADVIMAIVDDNTPEYIKEFLVIINPKAEENMQRL